MKELLKRLLYEHQKEDITHIPMSEEFDFYRSIAQGNENIITKHGDAKPTEHMGILSKNSLRNAKYHLIIMTAMITRFCIEGGLDAETAYTMSDYFINGIDTTTKEEDLSLQKQTIIKEYAHAMKSLNQKCPSSYHITRAMDYIQKNITRTILPKDVAAFIGISEDYLSRLFKKETGLTLSDYIMQKKCDVAKYMLVNSSASCSDISTFLGFSSSSHFIKRFKEKNGLTPTAFRNIKNTHPLSGIPYK